jgi:SAM-dependent methyltransferase
MRAVTRTALAQLCAEYERQARFRHWDRALAGLPLRPGARVLDLGCGLGQVAGRLRALGAEVIGVDQNAELLRAARTREPGIVFEHLDLDQLEPTTFGPVQGIWASFVAAYFCDLPRALKRFGACLAAGGWMALVEIDDLFGHEPLPQHLRARLQQFYVEARHAGRYDFESGRRLAGAARSVGLRVIVEDTVPDDELSFEGPATQDVLQAWQSRLQRMAGLRAFFGADFPELEQRLLEALASPAHRSACRVFRVVAERP